MIKIIARQDFIVGNQAFIKGDEVKIKNYDSIIKLNEKGLIGPLSYKDLILIKRELQSSKKDEKEVD